MDNFAPPSHFLPYSVDFFKENLNYSLYNISLHNPTITSPAPIPLFLLRIGIFCIGVWLVAINMVKGCDELEAKTEHRGVRIRRRMLYFLKLNPFTPSLTNHPHPTFHWHHRLFITTAGHRRHRQTTIATAKSNSLSRIYVHPMST